MERAVPFRSGNPTLTSSVFRRLAAEGEDVMTVQGTVAKTFILLFLVVAFAAWTWGLVMAETESPLLVPLFLGGALGGFVMALVTVFAKRWALVTAPLYAALEGLFLGALSAFFEKQYPGIAIQAMALTMATLLALLLLYTTRLIKPSENFKLGVFAATGAVALVYAASMVLGFFGLTVPFIHDSGPLGIIVSLVIVVIAALNLVLDFDFIESGAEQGAPKYMEWYAAFGLLVTLVWLYVEILRLLSKLRRR